MVLTENEPVTVQYASDFVSLDQAVSDLQAPKPETRWCLLELPPDQLKTLEEGQSFHFRELSGGAKMLTVALAFALPSVHARLGEAPRNVTGPSPEDLLPGGAARREEYWENATLRWNVDPSMSELQNMRRRAGYEHLATTTRYGDTCCASCGSIDTAKLVRGTGFYAVASAESMQDHGIGMGCLSCAKGKFLPAHPFSYPLWAQPGAGIFEREIKIVVADTCPHHGNEVKEDGGNLWMKHSLKAPGDGFAALCTADSTFRVEFLENSNTLLLGQVKSVDKENAGHQGTARLGWTMLPELHGARALPVTHPLPSTRLGSFDSALTGTSFLVCTQVCGAVTATASIAVRTRRVSVRRCAMKRIQRVAVVGGTHGNELSGVILVRSWMRKPSFSEFKSLHVDTFLANEEAVQRCQRFVDEDLNRCFAKSRLSRDGADSEGSEPKRAREINLRIGPRGSETASDLCIDLHNTTSNFGSGIIITNTSSPDLHWRLQLCARLARDCPDVHIVFDCVGDSSDEPFLPLVAKTDLTFEVGPQAHGTIVAEVLRRQQQLVLGTLDFLERYNAGQLSEEERRAKTIEVYILQSVVHYPRRSDGSLSAIIAPNLQGCDFSLLHPGDPVFQDIDTGASIAWEGPECFPVFVNEAAYLPSFVAFHQTQRCELVVPELPCDGALSKIAIPTL
ncbi:N-acyl-aromatic-L-amino acid amidohydrolase (carboxylate-forming) [Symbiodinium microadriaticum]|uniref:N-acyl-aromatic-L-amino acid amidohydrolase (Carboxylate-forming) n=1 Tax=Symbiodinium microadriaticum TaxID=2951 RepID=A0A1Q9E3N7_SYMMI|nr:N-acyl-aromatic-L-amino acid amidohydrolase (carboxylate-forming) [Symbiodinium microadriaticum]